MQVLKRPIITEKVTALKDKGQYAFEVDVKANKIEVRKALEKQFDVEIVSIRTANIRPKRTVQFTKKGRFAGKTAARKKVYVTVKTGQSIDIGTGATE